MVKLFLGLFIITVLGKIMNHVITTLGKGLHWKRKVLLSHLGILYEMNKISDKISEN